MGLLAKLLPPTEKEPDGSSHTVILNLAPVASNRFYDANGVLSEGPPAIELQPGVRCEAPLPPADAKPQLDEEPQIEPADERSNVGVEVIPLRRRRENNPFGNF